MINKSPGEKVDVIPILVHLDAITIKLALHHNLLAPQLLPSFLHTSNP
jgi:hypothetical protein